jgi:hypothetical protein
LNLERNVSLDSVRAFKLWQMATPGPEIQRLYRSDPRLAHAVVEVGPRLTRVLTAILIGLPSLVSPTQIPTARINTTAARHRIDT